MLYGAMNFPVRPVLEEIEAFACLGFDYLELAMDPPQAHHSILREQAKEIRQALQQAKMGLVCHLPSFVSTADLTQSLRKASLQEMLDSLQTAALLQPMKVVVHPSYLTGLAAYVPEQAREYAMQSLAAIASKGQELGLMLCLENMFPKSMSLVEPAEFEEVFQSLPALKLTLDTGHARLGASDSSRILEFIARFPQRLEHIHASDNLGYGDHHLPVGAGVIDFPQIVRSLQSVGYDKTVTLEIFSQDRDYLAFSRDKLAADLDYR
ncbi:MAG: sugar phosphate isomerase/epimerase family protein [Desulfovermiculus sp.]